MFLAILGFLKSFFDFIPQLKKWFTPNPTRVIEDEQAKLRKEREEFEKTGRPPQT